MMTAVYVYGKDWRASKQLGFIFSPHGIAMPKGLYFFLAFPLLVGLPLRRFSWLLANFWAYANILHRVKRDLLCEPALNDLLILMKKIDEGPDWLIKVLRRIDTK